MVAPHANMPLCVDGEVGPLVSAEERAQEGVIR